MPLGRATKKAMAKVREEMAEIDSSVSDQSLRRLAKAQLALPDRPVDGNGVAISPQLPPDLTILSNQELGALYTEFCAMVAYAYGQAALTDVEYTIKREAHSLAKTKAMLASNEAKLYLKKAETKVGKQFQKLARDELVAESTAKLTQAVLEGFITGKESTSREITRRQGLVDREPR